VSYTRHFERETYVNVFIDQAMVFTSKMFDYHYFDTASTTYAIHIGKDFPGIVRTVKLNSRAYVADHTNTLLISTDSSMCQKQGSTQCQFCDIEQTTGIAATPYNCYPTCDSFAYYIDGSGTCKECHPGCRYCMSSYSRANCYLCNSKSLFVQDTAQAQTTGLSPTSENA